MYAIIESGGKQYRVHQGETILVDHLKNAAVGSEITIDRVLMVGGDAVRIGTPMVAGAKVIATVIDHPRGKKLIAFKYRPTRRYRRRVGFRATHTALEITGIQV